MSDAKEIGALFTLLEDPDAEVFEVVSNRILQYGSPIIPQLEELWENSIDSSVQEKVENIIHRLHFTVLVADFKEWQQSGHHELLPATLLVAKFLYPDLHAAKTILDIERLKKNIWLELNNYLTPLEQVNVFLNILYGYFGLKGNNNNYEKPNEFLIPNIIASKKGNQTGIGTLCLLLAELLDIPLRYIPLPDQFVLGYFKANAINPDAALHNNIEFYVDPTHGQVFTHHHLYDYLQKTAQPVNASFFIPQNNNAVIQKLLSDFSKCFTAGNKVYMQAEINELIALLA